MAPARRRILAFVTACIVLFAIACIATSQSMIALIQWYLDNCGSDSASCRQAAWLISYWWLVFVPASMGFAASAYWLFLRAQADTGTPQVGRS